MIKILIVDDEPAASNVLKLLLEKHVPVQKTIVTCNNPTEAPALIHSFKPTLLMLDIQMPGMSGFDLLNSLGSWDFDLIFTTAYDQYAIRAIRFSAHDYLLKPIDVLELQNAVNRHIIHQTESDQHATNISGLLQNLQHGSGAYMLTLSTSEGVFQFHPASIIRVEGLNNYSRFFFTDHPPLLVSRTIKEYEELLADSGFLRVHKSHLVSRAYIRHIDKEHKLWLTDGSCVSVSRRKKEEVLQALRTA
jgi:two-component system LytT family response regulator